MHKNGDRVLVPRGEYWYPGTIRHVEGERFFVICDDGEDGFFRAQQMTALNLGIGDRIYVRSGLELDYQPARILDRQGDNLQVERPGEGPAWVPLSQVRIAPSRRSAPDAVRPESVHEIGERVWACGLDLFWYPAILLGESEEGGQAAVSAEPMDDSGTKASWKVLFDFGGYAMLPADQLVPLTFDVGDRIQCRWQAGNEFFPGQITRRQDEIIDIHYDDDDRETTSIRLARLERDDWLPAAEACELGPGDRVLGCWFDRFWYPGIILAIQGKRIHVLFDDNDQAFLTWDRVRPLVVEVGDRVLCRLKGGAFYLPGEILRKKDERIFVKYDDGQEEWTSVRLLRLER